MSMSSAAGPELLPEQKRATSASLRRTRPGNGPLFPLTHLGNSSFATLLGFSPLLRRFLNVESCRAPAPQLNVKDTKASNCS